MDKENSRRMDEQFIKKSISEIPETITIVKALQREGYQTGMLSDVTQ